MLDIIPQDVDPGVLPYFPDRIFRRRELRVSKCAHCYGGDSRPGVDHIGNRRSTCRAEAAGDPAAAIGDLHPFGIIARHDHVIVGPACLHRKRASAALLAVEAVAHRDAHGSPVQVALSRPQRQLAVRTVVIAGPSRQ